MHSARALLASSFVIPLVLALHSASLLFFVSAAGLAERQLFMNALRSSPFLSPACSLQDFIFSCCDILASVGSAAYAPPHAKNPTSARARTFFIARLLREYGTAGTPVFETSLRHPSSGAQRFRGGAGRRLSTVS